MIQLLSFVCVGGCFSFSFLQTAQFIRYCSEIEKDVQEQKICACTPSYFHRITLSSRYSQSYVNISFLTIDILDFGFFFSFQFYSPECLAFPSIFLFAFSLNQLHSSYALVENTLFPILRYAF